MMRRQALTRIAAGLLGLWQLAERPGTARATDQLRFAEIYDGRGPLGIRFSSKALGLKGRLVTVQGFLAPPLKAEAGFFVLCATPVALCPFCQSDADWPQDIIVVYPRSGSSVQFRSMASPIEVAGVLDLGSKTDSDTGFVSQVRLVDAAARPV